MRSGERGGREAGFTYLGVIAAVLVLGVSLASAGQVWQFSAQRERERELLFVGGEYRRAIERYYRAGAGAVKRYPRELADLLQDHRFPMPVRHLRRLYADPMTGSREWGIVRAPDGGIMGVHSLSSAKPVKVSGFDPDNARFVAARRYSDWRFTVAVLPAAGQR